MIKPLRLMLIGFILLTIGFAIGGYTDGLGISLISLNGVIAATGLIMFFKGLADYSGKR
ncbi:hypothetical protein ACMGE7_08465 [Macrococcus equi]|uniref:hypothetical protein n=1 Tax=Macrococcus equi TaxID=3395462 RepID=UPI0039BE32FA